jgi:branched-chain amino acid transport system permease protein
MILQPLANALLSASVIALVGLGFHVVFRVGKFFHFAHGAVFTLAPYLTFLFAITWGIPVVLSVLLAIGVSVALGCLIEKFCYRPIRKTANSSNSLLVCSLGIFIVIQATIALCFGSETKSLRFAPVVEGWELLGMRLTTAQIIIVLGSIVCLIGTWVFIRFSKSGRQLGAVASDPFLARVVGIRVERTLLLAIALGSLLAAVAGILVSYDTDMSPTMGMYQMMLAVVAVLIGGNTIWGTAAGALLLAMAQHFTVLVFLPSKWQEAIAFLLLIIFLVFRPQGVFGHSLRKTTV